MAAVSPPPKVPGFVLTEKLGSGTYATVFKAYRIGKVREVVAIKCVLKSSLTKKSTENLLTEIAILKKVKHDHIVELKDFQWDDKHIYLIMEYCSGGDLSGFIKSRRCLSEQLVKRFLQQLALALQFLRTRNISHMDLKPQNILLKSKEDPKLKLADFGFAQFIQEEETGQTLRGSPLYMAPEMLLKQEYDARVDLWSVGVIMYECLFGRAPYASKSWVELAEKIKNPTPVEIPFGVEISTSCRDLLLRLLERDPRQRITFDDFFAHPFPDLEHAPSAECMPKAVQLVTDAVEKDRLGDAHAAVRLYCQALDFFVPAIQYEPDQKKRELLRNKVQQYVSRAEELKQLLVPKKQLSSGNDSAASKRDLDVLTNEDVKIAAALKLIEIAEYKDKREGYEEALEKYEMALGALLPILTAQEPGSKKDVLVHFVNKWMTRAETLKSYLEFRKLEIQKDKFNYDLQDNLTDSFISKNPQCVIQ